MFRLGIKSPMDNNQTGGNVILLTFPVAWLWVPDGLACIFQKRLIAWVSTPLSQEAKSDAIEGTGSPKKTMPSLYCTEDMVQCKDRISKYKKNPKSLTK